MTRLLAPKAFLVEESAFGRCESARSIISRYDKPKPNWPDSNEKPWQKPVSRPSYQTDKYDDVSNQAQKWPPERPSWNKHDHRPNGDIITDDRPANFPSTWSRPQTAKPSYPFADKYSDKGQSEGGSNWHDYPSRPFEQDRPRPTLITERPNFSHYQYVNNHPSSHPASGDGQWVLLSTNRGYAKSRQRSIKFDAVNPELVKRINATSHASGNKEEQDPAIPVMTSKRQVRLNDQRDDNYYYYYKVQEYHLLRSKLKISNI